jgi:hypothetical protein
MDSYREFPSEFDAPGTAEASVVQDVAAAIGTDERRMHVRAYNYWVALLNGRDFPSIEDLEPADLKDFSSHSVLLDFTCGRDNPAVPYVGDAVREECGLDDDVRTIADIPSRSLLSRLTDHYMQIIANRAPVGFEAEFENPRGESICYRGILMPFSSDGDTIDFIYGVINWKNVAGARSEAPPVVEPVEDAAEEAPLELEDEVAHAEEAPLDLTIPFEEEETAEPPQPVDTAAVPRLSWDIEPEEQDADDVPEVQLDENAGLADRLWAARETAESVKAGEGRTRVALYRALALAYDFALSAQQNAEDYAELLEESGVKAQTRAPMTPIVKLVFGIDYDKARLTEFAAALSHAQRQDVALGAFQAFIEAQSGGLKALVAAERQARRPQAAADTNTDAARARLRKAPTISLAEIAADEEFAVVVTRRGPDGRHEPVAVVDDQVLIDRAIRRAA